MTKIEPIQDVPNLTLWPPVELGINVIAQFYRVPRHILESQQNGTVDVPRLSDEQRKALREEWNNVYCTGKEAE